MDMAFLWPRAAAVTEWLNAKEPKGWPGGVQGKGRACRRRQGTTGPNGPAGPRALPLRQFLPGRGQGLLSAALVNKL
tara:strand:+ start:69305 stop:69535 length:231 start_codon:yes stop_codon:yes gene_type:complete